MTISIEEALAKLRSTTQSPEFLTAIEGASRQVEQEHTFNVTFFGQTLETALTARVVATTVMKAMIAAKEILASSSDLKLCNVGVTVERIDVEAEKERAIVEHHLLAQQDDAVQAFVAAGYVKVEGREWYRHPTTLIFAAVDSHTLPVGGRFAGLYAHRLDNDNHDVYQPLVMIPWYGDGASADQQIALLYGALAV